MRLFESAVFIVGIFRTGRPQDTKALRQESPNVQFVERGQELPPRQVAGSSEYD